VIMLMSVFAIYDSGVSAWRMPIFARNKGEALRSWVDAVNNPQYDYSKYPQDFTLFELGTFDDVKCKFDLLQTPVSLGLAIEFVKREVVDSAPQLRAVEPTK
jgi:hypothetical protein